MLPFVFFTITITYTVIMKEIRHLLAVVLTFVAVASQASGSASLPVLRIAFPDKIVKNMPYSNGTMSLTDTDGNVVEMKAKFKTRGATAQQYLMKPALNMKLQNEDYTEEADSALLGIRSCSTWILDAMAIDRICMRNRVTMDVWNEYSRLPYETDFDGRHGTAGRFIELYINDVYYGIYCMSDRINRKLLDLKKYDEKKELVRGVLYKSGTSDIDNQNERGFSSDSLACTVTWHNAWELKEPEDHAGLAAWQPLLDLYDNQTNYAAVKKYFFLENLVDYQLLVMAFSIGDNWGNKNHYFSIRNIQKDIDDADPTESARRKVVVTPWDLDASLGGAYDGRYYDGTYSQWSVADISKNGFYPFSYCQGQSEYKALMKSRWQQVRKTVFSKLSVNKRLEEYRDLFINSGAWQRMTDAFDARSSKPCYVSDLAQEVAYIEKWYSDRFTEMDSYFGVTTIMGDANGDGIVSVADANSVVNYFLGNTAVDIDLNTADVNGDGTITIADANAIVNLYIGQ